MLGIIILLISLVLYFKPKHRYLSYFIYIGFMTGYSGGYGLLTDGIIGIKNMDLAIIYSFIINFYLLSSGRLQLPRMKFIIPLKVFIVFLLCSIIFSFIYYQFTPYQILQGGRKYLLIFCIPILLRIKPEEIFKILRIWISLVLFTSILYILQILTGQLILPYVGEGSIDSSTGLLRVYNMPFGLPFFLSLTFLAPQYFKYNINIYKAVFFTAIMCTLGRTGIFTSILTVFLAILLVKGASKLIRYILLLAILFIPFIGTLSNRFDEGGTGNDMQQLMSGRFDDRYESQGDATMTYRLAWLYERTSYLINQPLGEQIFGMGMISDSQPLTHKLYNFKLGLFNEETGRIEQLNTPDISYGNFVCQLGFVGTVIYLWLVISLTIFFYKQRKIDPILSICTAVLLLLFVVGFASSGLSNINTFSYLFAFIPLYKLKNNQKVYESNTYRVGLR